MEKTKIEIVLANEKSDITLELGVLQRIWRFGG
jgi:hypothetical protein